MRTQLALVCLLGACTYAAPQNIDPLDGTQLTITSGDAQSGLVGTTLVAPIVIRATDGDGAPLPELTLSLELAGGGSIPDPAVRTDAQGYGHTVLTLGTVPGENRVLATVLGLDLEPVAATATALVGPPVALAIASGDAQQAIAGDALAAPFVVRAADVYDNPVPEVPISFLVLDGGGSIAESIVSTGVDGTAATTLTLGTTMGANTVEARVGTLPEVVFAATGIAGAAASIVKVSGDAQSAPAGSTLPQQLTVRVEDVHGNPVAGADVEFVPLTTGGSVNPTHAVSGSTGLAMTTYRLSTALGANSIDARLPTLPVATFAASAISGAVTQVVQITGNGLSGTVAATVGPLTVEARDSVGNPVSGAIVQFVTTQGNGTAITTNVTTNASGRASTNYRLGTIAGANVVQPRVNAVNGTSFGLTGNAGAAVRLAITGTPVGRLELEQQVALYATAVDTYGNTVSGSRSISWSAGPHQVSPSSGTGTPTLSTVLTIQQMTDASVTASSSGLTPAMVTFDVRGFLQRVDLANGPSAQRLAMVDLNGDTKPDLVTTTSNGIGMTINTTLVPRTPRFGTPVEYLPNTQINDTHVADLNGDGRMDVIAVQSYGAAQGCNTYNGCVSVLFNNTSTGAATPVFASSILMGSEMYRFSKVFAADLNLDGRVDIFGSSTGNAFVVFLGTGAGAFGTPQEVTLQNDSIVGIGDLTVDGRPDLIGDSYIFVNTTSIGSSTLSFTVSYGNGGYNAKPLDFDGDGKLDLVSLETYTFYLRRNKTSPGATTTTFDSANFSGGGNQFAAGDLNADSLPDFVFGTNSSLSVLRSKVTPTVLAVSQSTSLALSTTVQGVAVGDVDGDGKRDVLAVCNYNTSQPSTINVFLSE